MKRLDGMVQLVQFWTTFAKPVDRRAYRVHGIGLVTSKYAVDATVIGVATGSAWFPWSYVETSPLQLAGRFAETPSYLAPLLAAWTLPFLWIGVCMTMRRLLDAGRSAWWSLLFFVPPLSYALMAVLAVIGSGPPPRGSRPDRHAGKLPTALLSIAAGTALGLGMLYLGVLTLNTYGLALFMGTPFGIGVVTGFLLCRAYPATRRETIEVVVMTVLVIGGIALALGWEGAVCVIMALPLSAVLAVLGGMFGRALANVGRTSLPGVALVPLALAAGSVAGSDSTQGTIREVRSEIYVAAPAEMVWSRLISFSPIPAPEGLLFRLGVAYPTHARIDGRGVGAVRYCEFSTGPFVEPITEWDEARRLSFDVVSSPAPLQELSLHDIKPPHLDGFMSAVRGEFRLVPLEGGHTRLEGSTWYRQSLGPEGYWALFSDAIVRMIHTRVLEHIAAESEATVGAP